MLSIVFLSLLGIGLASTLVGFSNDDDGDGSGGGEGDDAFTLENPDQEYALTSQTTLNAGAGDDTLSSQYTSTLDQSSYLENVDADGGSGDDTFNLLTNFSTIKGGTGDDLIEYIQGTGNTVEGNNGDDTINGVLDASTVDGGNGDDELNIIATDTRVSGGGGDDQILSRYFFNDASGIFEGGSGDDTILLDMTSTFSEVGIQGHGNDGDDRLRLDRLLEDRPLEVPPAFSGGEGADTFEVYLERGDVETDAEGNAPPSGSTLDLGTLLTISDFDASEDVLVIDVNNLMPGSTAAPLETDGYGVSGGPGADSTEIRIYLSAPDLDYDIQFTVDLAGLIEADAIQIAFTDLDPILRVVNGPGV